MRVTELAGLLGAALAGAAYVPQIWHLIKAHCSAGISRIAFGVWLAASLLVTSHALATADTVFVVLGAIQLSATTLILVFATKYQNSYCQFHLPRLAVVETEVTPNGSSDRWQTRRVVNKKG